MRKILRAIRPTLNGEVASCDEHLPFAMRAVTSPVDGDDNDTHIVVRRLGDDTDKQCDEWAVPHPAAWVLIPQAVLR